MKQAIQLIIQKSNNAASEAMQLLKAIDANSPMVQGRYRRVLEIAFHDADFTDEERAMLSSHLDISSTDEGSMTDALRIRVTGEEKAHLAALADARGMTLSAYVRQQLSL